MAAARMHDDLDPIVDEIIFLMTGREKSIFANMDEKDLPYVQHAFDGWLAGKVDDRRRIAVVVRRLWPKLGRTYRLRRIK